jgi:hypothetical protein
MVENGLDRRVGGTSASAPAFASVLALVNERLGHAGLGQMLPSLYRIGRAQARGGPVVFRDITQGTNGFPAGAGFDLASGWGAPLADALAATSRRAARATRRSTASSPGRGNAREGCAGQWLVEHPRPRLRRRGLPRSIQVCRDGDLACDADGTADGAAPSTWRSASTSSTSGAWCARRSWWSRAARPGLVRRSTLKTPKATVVDPNRSRR